VALFSYKPKLVVLEEAAAQVPSPRRKVEELAVPEARRAVATVPDDKFEAFKVVKFAPLTAPKDPDQVPEVIVPTVARLTAEVMLGCAAVVTVPAVVAEVAEVALVAVLALPFNVAVIVPALKSHLIRQEFDRCRLEPEGAVRLLVPG
jgi:hypothetical protein